MYYSVLIISSIILSVSCYPARHYQSSEDSDEIPFWLVPPGVSFSSAGLSSPYVPSRETYPSYGSISDELTKLLDEIHRALDTRVALATPKFPSIDVPSFSRGDSEESDSNTNVSIGGSNFGGGFSSLFSSFGGGLDTANLKNKTTVKTEVVDGHNVTIKESTYVTDNHGIKSVIHFSEVDVGDLVGDSHDEKPSKPKSESDEDTESEEPKEKKPEEEPTTTTTTTTTTENTENPETSTSSESDKPNKTEKRSSTTETPSDENSFDFRFNKPSKKDRDSNENRIKKDSDSEEDIPAANPNDEVEEIDPDDKNYYSYIGNGKIKTNKEEIPVYPVESWQDNEIDSTLPHPTRVVRSSGGGSLHDDTRVNQLVSEKQKHSGLYSIDPDAELLDEHEFYAVESQGPKNNQEVYYKPIPNQGLSGNGVSDYQYNQNTQRRRKPNHETQRQNQYQRRQPQPQIARNPYDKRGEYQTLLPVASGNFQDISPENSNNYQRFVNQQISNYQQPINQQSGYYHEPVNPQSVPYQHPINPKALNYQQTINPQIQDSQKRDTVNSFTRSDIQEHIPITFK